MGDKSPKAKEKAKKQGSAQKKQNKMAPPPAQGAPKKGK
jgi:hypothetical protein